MEKLFFPRREKGRAIGTALFLAAFFGIGIAALVEGPQRERQPQGPAERPALMAAVLPAPDAASRPQAQPGQDPLREAANLNRAPSVQGLGPLCDANGYPLAAKATYVRMVYQAFPPADMPG